MFSGGGFTNDDNIGFRPVLRKTGLQPGYNRNLMFLPQPNQIVDVFIIIDRAGNYTVGNQLITTVLLLVKPFADSKQQGGGAVENQFFGIAGRVMQFAADEKSQQNDGRVKN